MKYSFSLTPLVDKAPQMRPRVERLERALAQLPQAECPTRMLFAPGIAMREMTVPKDVTATGAIHKTEHRAIVVGHCLLTTDDGVTEIKGFANVLSKPGAKRAIYAIEETVVTTIHPTDETDEAVLCELLTESTKDELLGGPKNIQLLAQHAQKVGV